MSKSVTVVRPIAVTLAFVAFLSVLNAQSFLPDLRAVRDPAKRSERALAFADAAFDNARGFYAKGEIENGDAQLDDMTSALTECVRSLAVARKPQLYKKAELKVAFLQRHMQALVSDIELQKRGWAVYTERKLDEIHDKLLDGVIRK
jgi:hypothetical protein